MSRQSEKELRLRDAIQPLLDRPDFAEWMEGIAGNRERTLSEFGNYQTISDKRVTAVAIAELSVYEDIVEIYEEAHPGWEESLERPRPNDSSQAERLAEAMRMLVGDPIYLALIQEVRRAFNEAKRDLRVAKTDKASLAAIGRMEGYRSILSAHRAHLEPVANQLVEVEQERAE